MKKSEINLEGKIAVVTGATGVIGRGIVRHFLNANATVIMAARNLETAGKFLEEIKTEKETAKVSIMKLDVSSVKSIHEFVANLKEKQITVDYFIHNAGILNNKSGPTEEGLEIHFATNYFSSIYLTRLIMPILSKEGSRVIFQSSPVYKLCKLDWTNLQSFDVKNKVKIYARTKRLINLTVTGMHQKYKENYPGTEFIIVHPGVCGTDIFHYKHGGFPKWVYHAGRLFCKILFHSPKIAALPAFEAAFKNVPAGYQLCPKGLFEIWGKPKARKLNKKILNAVDIEKVYCEFDKLLENIEK